LPKLHSILATSLMFLSVVFLRVTSSATDFDRANQYYQDKSYDSALTLYNGVARSGDESAELYYNIGNCYFKKGDLGHAVLYYQRAKRLAPSDDDIDANLAFAKSYTRIQMEGVQLNPVNSMIESLLDPFKLNTLAWAASICFILFILILTARFGLGWSTTLLRGGTVIGLVILCLAVFATTYKYRHDYLVKRAVVIAEDCPVQSGPTDQSQTELRGAPGLVVEIVGQSGDYYNVLFENKRQGWIRQDQIAVI
jgi:tetratricopeptide (TPR) repeat protein